MALPTPPGTSHRDKENRVPSGMRVVFSPYNHYRTLTAVSPPKFSIAASASKDPPTKSILKKPHHDHVLLPFPDENQKEPTPEPSDPLTDAKYLESPVSKIVGPDPPLRELIESYSILGGRLRAAFTDTTSTNRSWPLLLPIETNRDALIDAFIRDLGRALVDPPKMDFFAEEHSAEENVMLPSPKDTPPKKKGMSAEQAKYARDLCTTCHAVIKLLITLFTLPAAYKIFTSDQLRAVIMQVVAIPMADQLPTPNARKTWMLSIGLLQSQRLPSEVLVPTADHIAIALKRGIDGRLGKEGKKGAGSDGLKAIHDLAIYQPSTFVPAFSRIIPSILSNLLENGLAIRVQACTALNGLVLGCTSLPFSPAHERISTHISTFLSASSPASQSPMKPTQEAPIIRTLRATLNATYPQHAAQGPAWALSVLASFIVLMGPALYMDAKMINLVSSLLLLSLRHKKGVVRALGCLVWRCIAWVYFQPWSMECNKDANRKDRMKPQISYSTNPLQMINRTSQEADVDVQTQLKQREEGRNVLWKVVNSLVDMGAGVYTIAELLRDDTSRDDALMRVMSVIKLMVQKGGQTCGDAMELAKRFIAFNTKTDVKESKMLPTALFSSVSNLLATDFKSLLAVVRPMFNQCPGLEDVRPFTREELAQDWVFDDLMEVWKEGLASLEMVEDVDTPAEVTSIWGGLLKAKVEMLQDAGDTVGASKFLAQMVNLLINILQDPQLDLTDKEGPPTVPNTPTKEPHSSPEIPEAPVPIRRSNIALKLNVTRDLWSITRLNVPPLLLKEPAATFFANLIGDDQEFLMAIDTQDACQQWALLCADVLSCCGVDEVNLFWGATAKDQPKWEWLPHVCQLMWKAFVSKWTESGPESWEQAAILLGVPLADATTWDLSNDDFISWDSFLRCVVNLAMRNKVTLSMALDHVADVIVQYRSPTFAHSARVVEILVSHLRMAGTQQIPSSLLHLVNDVLRSSYPPEPCNKVISMWMIRSLTQLIDTCPADLTQTLLEKVQDGLSIWVADECGTLSQEEYVFDILPLYETTLLSIRLIPCGVETLNSLSPIITSAFRGRGDKPSSASEAFVEFWNATYSSADEPEGGWPPEIRICLQSTFGTPLTDHGSTNDGQDDTTYDPENSLSISNGDPSDLPDKDREDEVEKLPCVHDNTDSEVVQPESPAHDLVEVVHPGKPPGHDEGPSSLGSPSPSLPAHSPSINAETQLNQPTHEESDPSLLLLKTLETFSLLNATMHPMTPPHTRVPPPSPSTPIRRPPTMLKRTTAVHLANEIGSNTRGMREDKENISPQISPPSSDIAEHTPSVLGKRRMLDTKKEGIVSKKVKIKKVKSVSFSTSIADPLLPESCLPTRASSLHTPVKTSRTREAEESGGQNPNPPSRKRKAVFMESVEVPTLREVRRRKRQRTIVFDSPSPSDRKARRAGSTPKLAQRSGSCEPDRDGTGREIQTRNRILTSLIAVQEIIVPGSDDSTDSCSSQPPKDLSSDDDPFDGQVTPHHLISPPPRRAQKTYQDPPSDDSTLSASPSRDAVARRLQRENSFIQLAVS